MKFKNGKSSSKTRKVRKSRRKSRMKSQRKHKVAISNSRKFRLPFDDKYKLKFDWKEEDKANPNLFFDIESEVFFEADESDMKDIIEDLDRGNIIGSPAYWKQRLGNNILTIRNLNFLFSDNSLLFRNNHNGNEHLGIKNAIIFYPAQPLGS